jgi:hypothetical protein
MPEAGQALRLITFENVPAPPIPARIQQELTRLGGVIPPGFGRFSGKPVLKLVWGQTETAFENGKERLRFIDQDIDPVFTKRVFRLTDKGQMELSKWAQKRSQKMQEAFDLCKWDEYHALLFSPMEYFLKRHIPATEWAQLPATSSFEDTARLLPPGWHYFEDMPEMVEIGSANYFVVGWLPGPEIDEKWNWEINRFGKNPLLEFRGDEHFVDILGEYPQYGDWFNVLLKIEDAAGGYAQPDEHNCLEVMRKRFRDAGKRNNFDKSKAGRVKNRLGNALKREELACAARKDRLRETFHERGQIVGTGENVRVIPRDRRTKWGKPKEIIIAGQQGNKE